MNFLQLFKSKATKNNINKTKIIEIGNLINETSHSLDLLDAAVRFKSKTQGEAAVGNYEKMVMYVNDLDLQVFNGGFVAYFTNCLGDQAPATLNYLDEIKAHRVKKLLAKAMQLVNPNGPDGQWPTALEIEDYLVDQCDEDVRRKLNELDQEYYKRDEDVGELIYQCIKKNINRFDSQYEVPGE